MQVLPVIKRAAKSNWGWGWIKGQLGERIWISIQQRVKCIQKKTPQDFNLLDNVIYNTVAVSQFISFLRFHKKFILSLPFIYISAPIISDFTGPNLVSPPLKISSQPCVLSYVTQSTISATSACLYIILIIKKKTPSPATQYRFFLSQRSWKKKLQLFLEILRFSPYLQ